MYYTKPSFTLPAVEGKQTDLLQTCTQHGHMEPDRRGKCMRCGTPVQPTLRRDNE